MLCARVGFRACGISPCCTLPLTYLTLNQQLRQSLSPLHCMTRVARQARGLEHSIKHGAEFCSGERPLVGAPPPPSGLWVWVLVQMRPAQAQ